MTDSGLRGGAVALAVTAGLLVSCGEGLRDGDRPAPAPTPSTAPGEPEPETASPPVPAGPTTDDADRLVAQLEQTTRTLSAVDAPADDVRRAAEFQQLATRALAAGPPAFAKKVVGLLNGRTARDTRADVEAAGLLLSMLSEPAQELPEWRIVPPPPAGELLSHYRRAQREEGVHWSYLAAIHLVETRMGRIRGVSTAGAVGPMQFLPTTWDLYGEGGDIRDPGDAILAATRLLVANGAPDDMADAVWHYNPSDAYVGAVLSYARTMRRSPSAYERYWHWRVLYTHQRGTYVLPVGYPQKKPVLVAEP
ncbi:MAG: lytic transglycosylase domain-containing protein [Nocardioides sp.]|nr:lytic transglycosylase domain-containing protein [Nocardioides sp.]